jgi:uncharacterized repeat protein (TIGR03803 family)
MRNTRSPLKLAVTFAISAACGFALPQIGRGQSFTTLHYFTGGTDGGAPAAALTQANDGYLYGTTTQGGAIGKGTVFQVVANGTITTLFSFSGGLDGSTSWSRLIQAGDGKLYGTTMQGGGQGAGTIFQITTAGVLTTLYNFGSNPSGTDGGFPYSGLVVANNGSLYGTTAHGGFNGNGTVYEISTGGGYSSLYSFSALNNYTNADGCQPWASLMQASDGTLYGTTVQGGASTFNYGTVFRITTSGAFVAVHSFSGGVDGGRPIAGLIQASDGNMYGAATVGGVNGDGTIFRVTPDGSFTILHSFSRKDGICPNAALIQASDGNLYGTTSQGGSHASGTVFRITTGGTLATLYNFGALDRNGLNTDGASPKGLVQTSDGKLYGTTALGGVHGAGTVFGLFLNLPPR